MLFYLSTEIIVLIKDTTTVNSNKWSQDLRKLPVTRIAYILDTTHIGIKRGRASRTVNQIFLLVIKMVPASRLLTNTHSSYKAEFILVYQWKVNE